MRHSTFSSWSIKLRLAATLFIPILTALLSISSPADLKHKPWIEKDWTRWTDMDCYYTVNVSPWVYEDFGSGRWTGSELQYPEASEYSQQIRIEFTSALPIRQARLRKLQLLQHYDRMTAQKRNAFDQQHANDLKEADDDPIRIYYSDYFTGRIVSDTVTLPPREAALKLSDGTLVTATQTTLTTSPSDIPLRGYSITYVFPRKFNGKPLYSPNDKTVWLVFGGILRFDKDHKQFGPERPGDFHYQAGGFDFHIAEMMYKGKLEY
jgi:hypothetical protein